MKAENNGKQEVDVVQRLRDGKSIIVCAADADFDGWTDFWSEDTVESVIER